MNGDIKLITSIHIERIPTPLWLRENTPPKRQTTGTPDGVIRANDTEGYIILCRLRCIPFLDRFVQGTCCDFVVGEARPVDTVDFRVVCVDLVDGFGAFL
jgi:hypothetical protein